MNHLRAHPAAGVLLGGRSELDWGTVGVLGVGRTQCRSWVPRIEHLPVGGHRGKSVSPAAALVRHAPKPR